MLYVKDRQLVSTDQAADLLGDGVEARHVRARLLRGSLQGVQTDTGWFVRLESINQELAATPLCEACRLPSTTYVIVKYPHHDRVEFELCTTHGADAVLSYGRQGQVLEVVSFPYQSEGWLKPRPR